MILPEYKSFEDKAEFFECKKIETFEEFLKIVEDEKLKRDRFYRGVNSGSFKMFTSFQREYTKKLGETVIKNIANEDFMGLLLHHLQKDPMIQSEFKKIKNEKKIGYEEWVDLEWNYLTFIFSNLQHYGGISPFLDITDDILKATYFAFKDVKTQNTDIAASLPDNPETYASVLVFEKQQYENKILDYGTPNSEEIEDMKTVPKCYSDSSLHFIRMQYVESLNNLSNGQICQIKRDNYFTNENIIAQDGHFLFRSIYNIDKPFEESKLQYNPGGKILSFEISKNLEQKIKQYLTEKKITKETMEYESGKSYLGVVELVSEFFIKYAETYNIHYGDREKTQTEFDKFIKTKTTCQHLN